MPYFVLQSTREHDRDRTWPRAGDRFFLRDDESDRRVWQTCVAAGRESAVIEPGADAEDPVSRGASGTITKVTPILVDRDEKHLSFSLWSARVDYDSA